MASPIEVEFATYVSWPAFEQVEYAGWVLRSAGGYTKRANSINAISPATIALGEAVAYCEAFYEARHQPVVFRLLSFVDDPNLDPTLAGAGYEFIDPSLVLCQRLDGASDSALPAVQTGTDRELWLDVFNELSGADPARRAVHAGILQRIPAPSLFAVLEHEGRPVACGIGVLYKTWFGIFDLITRVQDRRQGHGTRLIKAMLAWARGNGGRDAYIQVLASNARAVRLYERLGYRRLYHYWYRVRRPKAGT